MKAYRCYLLSENGRIGRSEIIECATDAAALEEAARRLVDYGFPAIEIWEKERRVAIIRHWQDHLTTTAQNSQEASIEATEDPKPTANGHAAMPPDSFIPTDRDLTSVPSGSKSPSRDRSG